MLQNDHLSFRYPSYEFFSDSGISSLASKIDTRYSMDSLFGLIFDVTMLSECDYIVCTFSSQVIFYLDVNIMTKVKEA